MYNKENIIKDVICEPTVKLKMGTNIKYTHAIKDLTYLINDFLRLGNSPFISLEVTRDKFKLDGKQVTGYVFLANIIKEDYENNKEVFNEVFIDIIKKMADLNKYTFVDKINFTQVFPLIMELIPESKKEIILTEYSSVKKEKKLKP